MSANPFDPPATEPATTTTTTTKENTRMAETASNNKIVATLKGGSGFDAPWIVIHGDTPEEVLDILNDEQTKALLDQTQKVAGYFASKGSSTPAAGGRAPRQGQPAPSAGLDLSDKDLDKIEKETGQRVVPDGWTPRSGVGKNGKTWRAIMPPRDTDQSPIWL